MLEAGVLPAREVPAPKVGGIVRGRSPPLGNAPGPPVDRMTLPALTERRAAPSGPGVLGKNG
jgi:hypothetical protein